MKSLNYIFIFSIIIFFQIEASWYRVRIDKSFFKPTKEFIKEFVIDHKRSTRYLYGYLPEKYVETNLLPRSIEILGLDLPVSKSLYRGYLNYNQLTNKLKELERTYPNLTKLESAGRSVENRELWYLVISDNVKDEEPEPKLIYIANMHGDEVVGRELMVTLSEYLLMNYGSDSKITDLVNNSQIFIMPSMNPDGFEKGVRWNANEKDLNRNFPDFITDPDDSDIGKEIETKNLMSLAKKHHFISALIFHGGELCINIPWDGIPNNDINKKFGDDEVILKLAETYSYLNPPMYNNNYANFHHGVTYGYEWFPIYGGIQDFYNVYRNSIAATAEISIEKWPSYTQIGKFWNENRQSMLAYLIDSLQGAHFYVVDENGNEVKNIFVTTKGTPERKVFYEGPYINKPLVTTKNISIESEGFSNLIITASPNEFNGTFEKVTLHR